MSSECGQAALWSDCWTVAVCGWAIRYSILRGCARVARVRFFDSWILRVRCRGLGGGTDMSGGTGEWGHG